MDTDIEKDIDCCFESSIEQGIEDTQVRCNIVTLIRLDTPQRKSSI